MTTDELTQEDPAPGADAPHSDPSQEIKQEDAQPADAEGDGEGKTTDTPQPSELDKLKHGFQKRFDKVYGTAKDMERRALAAEAELEKYRKPQGAPTPPDPKDFDDDLAYGRAVGRYEAAKESHERAEQESQATAAREAEKHHRELKATIDKREAAFAKVHTDYHDVVTETQRLLAAADPDSIAVRTIHAAFVHDEDGPAIAYHLGKNPELFDQLLEMKTPLQIMRVLSKIEAPAAPDSKTKPTPQHAPPNPIGGKGTPGAKPLWELEGDAYRKARLGK